MDETLSSGTNTGTFSSLEIPVVDVTTMPFADPVLLPCPHFKKPSMFPKKQSALSEKENDTVHH